MTDHQGLYHHWKHKIPMTIEQFIDSGAAHASTMDYLKIYDRYLSLRREGKNYLEAVEATAEEMCTSSDTVKRAIAKVL